MTRTKIAVSAFALVLSATAASAASIMETFDTGANGWTAADPTGDYTTTYSSTGGNPGGYLQGNENDPAGGVGYFIAPSNFLGNLSAYAGGTLSYDFKIFVGTEYFNAVDVIISGNGNSASWSSNVNPVGLGWVNFSVKLDDAPGDFTGAPLSSILSNVTSLQIRGEFISFNEQEGIDNIMLTTAAVPGPTVGAGASSFALAALFLGWLVRRRGHVAV